MTEANKDSLGAIENNEQEMIDEGAPVQPSTDPVVDGDDDPAGTENEEGDSDEEPAHPDAADTDQVDTDQVAEVAQEAMDADAAKVAPETTANEDGVEVEEEAVQDTDLAVAESSISDGDVSDFEAEYKKRLREYTRELKKQPGDWYIIQSYAGYENKVKTNLDMRIQTLEVEDSIFEVVVPIEQVLEPGKDGKKKLVKRKLLPGYVLVRMEMNDAAWSVVRETPGVTSFVGNEGNATPVKHKDVAKFLLPKSAAVGAKPEVTAEGETVVAMPEEQSPSQVTHDYQVGEAVTILSGALASVSATINAIDPETGKIEALVSIFGRETPVELTADQIERIL